MPTCRAHSRTSSSRSRRWRRRWRGCRRRPPWHRTERLVHPSRVIKHPHGRAITRGAGPRNALNESSPRMSDSNTARPRVLVADPDPETSALLARALEWAGYEVSTASNGKEALELIARLRPAATVLEAKMELMNGYEVVRQVREAGHRRPILMISARAGKLDRDFAFTVGCDDYVKKPFHSSEVVARLALLVPTAETKPKLKPRPVPVARPVRRRPRPMPAFAR